MSICGTISVSKNAIMFSDQTSLPSQVGPRKPPRRLQTSLFCLSFPKLFASVFGRNIHWVPSQRTRDAVFSKQSVFRFSPKSTLGPELAGPDRSTPQIYCRSGDVFSKKFRRVFRPKTPMSSVKNDGSCRASTIGPARTVAKDI